jgi:DNA polymerase-3 subunit gamma/tau
MALNCERRIAGAPGDDGEPCGECGTCERIWSGSASMDVVEIDAASNRGVDDARELRERAMYAPSSESRYKVYIVDEAHMLTREAWNALLKILEEPPPRVVFVFATTEPQKIAQAAAPVLSRVQRFDLRRIGLAEIRSRLQEIVALEGVAASPDALAMIARAADGSMRDALSFTDQVLSHSESGLTVAAVRESLGLVADEEYLTVLDLVIRKDAAAVFPLIARLADAGIDFSSFLAGLAETLRSLLAQMLGKAPDDVSDQMRTALSERAGSLASGDVLRMLNLAAEVETRFRRSSQQQLLLETLLVRFAFMDRTVSIEQLLRDAGRESGGGGSSASDAPRQENTRSARGDRARAAPADSAAAKTLPAAPADTVEAPARVRSMPRPLEINKLAELWDDIIDELRASGRALLAGHLGNAIPAAVSAAGVITVRIDNATIEEREMLTEALAAAHSDLVSALRQHFKGVEKIVLAAQPHQVGAPSAASRRLTAEAVKAEKLANLRRKDPVLDAAVRELDLELLE